MTQEQTSYDVILRGGTVIDPATGRNGRFDVGVVAGRIGAIEPSLGPGGATQEIDVAGKLVIAGMIDTHAHVYEHVTGKFGLNADMVGVRSASTTLIDQGGPSCMTIRGFRHFVAEPASSRVLAFISNYPRRRPGGPLLPPSSTVREASTSTTPCAPSARTETSSRA